MTGRRLKRASGGEDDLTWMEGPAAAGAAAPLDKQELARLIGFPPKAIERWICEGCPTRGAKRSLRFVVADVVRWLVEGEADALKDARTRQAAALARKNELAVAQLEGRLVDINEIAAANRDRMARLQSDLLAIPARCPGDVQKTVREAIIEFVNRMSESS